MFRVLLHCKHALSSDAVSVPTPVHVIEAPRTRINDRRSPQAATSQLNGNTHAAAEARLRDAEAAAAQREADLKRERDALAAKCTALQSQIADLQAQLKAAKVRTFGPMLARDSSSSIASDQQTLR